jgi:hypothetical protein
MLHQLQVTEPTLLLPDFDLQISLPYHASHSNPFSIFVLYSTPQIVDLIVQYTNQNPRKAADPDRPNARANQWYPTTRAEVYVYLGIRIYMTIYPQSEIQDYWSTKRETPFHEFTRYMTRI